jgi:peroxiredoxin
MRTFAKWLMGLALVVTIFMLLFTGLFTKDQATFASSQRDENLAPDFTLKALDGKNIRLSQYRGQVVFLIFGTTWCPQCRLEIPSFKGIHSRYAPKGLVTLYVDIQESQNKVAAFARKNALPYPTLLDSDGTVAQGYGVLGVPTKILIDRNGKIICWNCRSFDALLEKQF